MFTFWIFHWDDRSTTESEWTGDAFEDVRHVWEARQVKLGFARAYLGPDETCDYDYVLLWDGDVVLSPSFDAARLLNVLEDNDVDIAQPALSEDSFMSYRHTKRVRNSTYREAWFVEVGFLVYKLETWIRVWELLSRYPFRLWWFDVLPFRCVVGAGRIAVVDEQWVVHESGGKTLKIDGAQVRRERTMRNEIVERFGCCEALREVRGFSKPSLLKCQCDEPSGMYC